MSSINHYYYTCSSPIPSSSSSEPHLWLSSSTTHQLFDDVPKKCLPSASQEMGKMGLFEKALTPSDVGKLNRLVIPKQHAERYFPLNGGGSNADEKGLLLSFEDDEDKTWRFRYSYWNSSQSYVLTKGWSRFVKDKKLQAGDIVVFLRHRLDHARLFIGWRRRSEHPAEDHHENKTSSRRSKDVFCYPIPSHHEHSSTSDLLTQPHSTIHSPTAGSEINEKLQQQVAAGSSGNYRKLRLFGVNLECQLADDHDESDDQVPNEQSPMFYQQQHDHHYHYQHHLYSNYYNHMDSNLSRGEDVYRQR